MDTSRRLAAIVFADMVGYTRQVSADETRGLEARRRFEASARASAALHSGRVVKMIGDAAMMEFGSAVQAVSGALDLQRGMSGLDDGERQAIRVGVHVGEVAEETGDLFGNAVNIAQRVHESALPGGISITREVYVQIRPIMNVECRIVRRQSGKPSPEPIEVYSVVTRGADEDRTPASRRGSELWTAAGRRRAVTAALATAAAAAAIGLLVFVANAAKQVSDLRAVGARRPAGQADPAVGSGPPSRPQPPGQSVRADKAPATSASAPRVSEVERPFAVVGGRYEHGGELPIGGKGLGRRGSILIGGVSAKATIWTPTRITARIPADAPVGQVPVVVVPDGGVRTDAGSIEIARPTPGPPPPTGTAGPWPRTGWQPREIIGYNDLTQGAYGRALEKADSRLRQQPDDLGAQASKALALALTGERAQAAQLADAVLASGSVATGAQTSLALLAKAVCLDTPGSASSSVLADYRRSVQSAPRLALPYYLWARALENRGQIDQSRAVLQAGAMAARGAAWAMRDYRAMAGRLGVTPAPGAGRMRMPGARRDRQDGPAPNP